MDTSFLQRYRRLPPLSVMCTLFSSYDTAPQVPKEIHKIQLLRCVCVHNSVYPFMVRPKRIGERQVHPLIQPPRFGGVSQALPMVYIPPKMCRCTLGTPYDTAPNVATYDTAGQMWKRTLGTPQLYTMCNIKPHNGACSPGTLSVAGVS